MVTATVITNKKKKNLIPLNFISCYSKSCNTTSHNFETLFLCGKNKIWTMSVYSTVEECFDGGFAKNTAKNTNKKIQFLKFVLVTC
jgi:hypothetical protein